MALVVADTSPLRFLVEIGYEHVLPRLFQQVWIPGAVASELQHGHTPEMVRRWAERLPPWVHVHEIGHSGFDPGLADIDRGEWEAIELAKEIHANLLLIDDRAGVYTAREQGFTVTGTLGVLVEAAASGQIQMEEALEQLGKTKFRRTADLFAHTAQFPGKLGGNQFPVLFVADPKTRNRARDFLTAHIRNPNGWLIEKTPGSGSV